MDDEFGLGGLINQFIDYNMESINTAIPAVVLAVKDGGRSCFLDVQPSVSILTKDGEVFSESSVLNVPMQQPASSTGGMVFPISPGDTVLLVFSQRGIDTWKYGNGGPSTPSDYRKFSRRDCIAIPCIFPKSESMADPAKQGSDYAVGDVVIYNNRKGNSVEIILKKNGDVIVNSPGLVQVNCTTAEVNASGGTTVTTPSLTVDSPTSTFTGAVTVQGPLSYKSGLSGTAGAGGGKNVIQGGFELEGGSVVHNGVNIGSNHTHPGVQSGGSSTGGPQ